MSGPAAAELRRLLEATGILGAARGRPGEVWLVGGAVRDLLLDRPVRDLDLLVRDRAGEFVRRLSGSVLASFPLNEAFGQWRLHLADGDGMVVCDLAPLDRPVEEDLARRDLTINAMALDLGSWDPALPPSPRDPFGGEADLAARVARMVSAAAFDDDPLRLLRVCRLAAELGLAVDEGTARAVRERAPLLAAAAPERIRDELVRLSSARRLHEGMRLAGRLSLLPFLVAEAPAMVGTPQDGHHHLNVWEHSLEALRWFEELSRGRWELLGEAGALVGPALDGEVVAGRPGGFLASLAILYHDVGKVRTSSRGEDGRLHFHGHPARGAEEVGPLRERFALAHREADALALLVRNHLRPGLLHASGNVTPRAVHRLLRDVGEWLPHLAALAWCDFLASRGPLSADRDLEGARRFTAELVEAFRRSLAPRPAPPIGGGDLMESLGLPPGPHLERIREALEEETAVSGTLGREDALSKARALVGADRWGGIRALVLDFDNTVSPTFPSIIAAFTEAQRRCGLDPLPPERLVRRFGPPEDELILRLVGPGQAATGIAAYREAHARATGSARLYDGMAEVLASARDAGLRTALVTGRGRPYLDDYLRVLGIAPLFDTTLAGDEVRQPKPDPEGLETVLSRLGVDPAHAAVVGDSPIDMTMAAAVGALPLAALWDSAYRRELIEGPAAIVFLSPRDLGQWIQALGTGRTEDGEGRGTGRTEDGEEGGGGRTGKTGVQGPGT